MQISSHLVGSGVQELNNLRLWQISVPPGSTTEATFWWNSNAVSDVGKHIQYYVTGVGSITVPRLDIAEVVTQPWAFNRSGSNPPFTCSQTLPSVGSTATRVTNFNAHYLSGYLADSSSAVSTIAQRDSSGRLKATDPSASDDLVNYGFLQGYVAGIRDPKEACRVSTTAALPANTRVSNTLTANANGSINVAGIDGITDLAVSDRVLVKDEATGANNGLFYVSTVGTAGTPWVLIRTTDADTDAEVTNGLQTWITAGTLNGSSGWLLTTADPIVLNTTTLTFIQINGTASILAGNGIVKVGNYIHAVQSAAYTQYALVYTATTSTLGLITDIGTATKVLHGSSGGAAPTWSQVVNADIANTTIDLAAKVLGILPPANGGTGQPTLTLNGVLYGNATGVVLNTGQGAANTVLVANAGAPSFSAAITVGTSISSPAITATTSLTTVSLTATGTTTLAVTLSGIAILTAGVVSATTGTQYGLPYFATTSTLASTAAGTTTTLLHGNAVGSPTWSAVSLTADVSGLLPVANGGIGVGTLTGIVYGNGTGALTAGNGTAGTVAKFSASSPGLTNSIITESGTTITIAGSLTVTGTSTLATSLTGMLKGASGVVSEVTGATNRVTFWSDANTLSSNAGFTYDATTLTLDADLTFTGAQTIQTSTGNLTLATAAGNGNVVVTPHGTGYLSVTNGIINRGFSTNGSNNNSNYITLTRANNTGEDNVLQWITASTSQWVLGSGSSYFGGEVFGLRYAPGSTNYLTMSTAGLLTLGGSLTFTGAQTISTSSGILTVTGTGGLTLTSGTSNTLLTQNSVNVFTSEGSGAIVNTLYLKAGNVGIGTTVPGVKFHAVLGGTAPSIVAATQTVAVFQNSAAAGDLARVSITSGNTAAAVLQLGDNDDDDIGGIYYDNATNYLGFRTNNTSDRMMISSAGVVNIAGLTASCVVLTDASKNLVSGAVITTGATIARTITVSIGAGLTPSVTHNLGTQKVVVSVRRIGAPYDQILVDNVSDISGNSTTFTFLVDEGAGIYQATFVA